MPRVRVASLVVALLALPLAVAPAHALQASACEFSFVVTISPGTGVTPNKGTISAPLGGSITCVGEVSGTGQVGIEGTYGATTPGGGDTCALGSGGGTLTIKIGTTAKSGAFSFHRAGAAGAFTGLIEGMGNLRGGFAFQPTTGDCVQTKVTKANVTGVGVLSHV
ncbi:MAG: hypothetical protein HY775_00255 [Acidobacteria bacterium]|nr:hypothetical protein [Acidobacteriota bacterium]